MVYSQRLLDMALQSAAACTEFKYQLRVREGLRKFIMDIQDNQQYRATLRLEAELEEPCQAHPLRLSPDVNPSNPEPQGRTGETRDRACTLPFCSSRWSITSFSCSQ